MIYCVKGFLQVTEHPREYNFLSMLNSILKLIACSVDLFFTKTILRIMENIAPLNK